LNSYLVNNKISFKKIQLTKIEEIEKIFNELEMTNQDTFYKYPEIFFSLKELENINIIKLIYNGGFQNLRCEYWTKVNMIKKTNNYNCNYILSRYSK
jgi:hypothetical protein